MSATQITAATARSSHGLASRNTTKANHVGHMTIHPAAAHASGDGRPFLASQRGANTTQKIAATRNAMLAAVMKSVSGERA
jgi:hypothetical protein